MCSEKCETSTGRTPTEVGYFDNLYPHQRRLLESLQDKKAIVFLSPNWSMGDLTQIESRLAASRARALPPPCVDGTDVPVYDLSGARVTTPLRDFRPNPSEFSEYRAEPDPEEEHVAVTAEGRKVPKQYGPPQHTGKGKARW